MKQRIDKMVVGRADGCGRVQTQAAAAGVEVGWRIKSINDVAAPRDDGEIVGMMRKHISCGSKLVVVFSCPSDSAANGDGAGDGNDNQGAGADDADGDGEDDEDGAGSYSSHSDDDRGGDASGLVRDAADDAAAVDR